jgi:hypothetical protein
MAVLVKSGLVLALNHAIDVQKRKEKQQGGDGKSAMVASWIAARDALCSGERVDIVDALPPKAG